MPNVFIMEKQISSNSQMQTSEELWPHCCLQSNGPLFSDPAAPAAMATRSSSGPVHTWQGAHFLGMTWRLSGLTLLARKGHKR